METPTQLDDQTPPDCFRLDELETFQTFEQQALTDVNYFVWLNRNEAGAISGRFLYTLELVFDHHLSLFVSSGEDSEAIRVVDAATVVKTAAALRALHQTETIEQIQAGNQPIWQPFIGKTLEAIRLSKHASGLYSNDAILLDFITESIIVALSPDYGLTLDAGR